VRQVHLTIHMYRPSAVMQARQLRLDLTAERGAR
jgi:hypothetical protein